MPVALVLFADCVLAASAPSFVLVSLTQDGLPGAQASGVTVFAAPLPAPVTNTGQVLFLSRAALWPGHDANQVIDIYGWAGTPTAPLSVAGVAPLTGVFGNARGIHVSAGGAFAVEWRPRDDLLGPVRPFVWRLDDRQAQELPLPGTVSVAAASVSADGRFVAFASAANDLDPAPGNGLRDVFRLDRQTGAVLPLRAAAAGAATSAWELRGSSASGARIAVLAGTGGGSQALLWDEGAGAPALTLLSRRADGAAASRVLDVCLSADGNWAVFASDDAAVFAGAPGGVVGIYAVDAVGSRLEPVSLDSDGTPANADCAEAALSGDGRFVVFSSAATSLAATETHGLAQIFLRDRDDGTTLHLSRGPAGAPADADCRAPAISPDGRYVTFVSAAANLTVASPPPGVSQVYLVDRGSAYANRRPQAFSDHLTAARGTPVTLALTAADADGDALAFLVTTLPSAGALFDGPAALPAAQIQPAGLPHRLADPAAVVTLLPDPGGVAALSFRFTAADAHTASLPATVIVTVGDADRGIITLLSLSPTHAEADGPSAPDGTSGRLALAAAGDRVAFTSYAANLVPDDGNEALDAFLWDRHAAALVRPSAPTPGLPEAARLDSDEAALSADGRFIACTSAAVLLAEDDNAYADIYLRDTETDALTRVSTGLAGQSADGNSDTPDVSADGEYVVFASTASNLVAVATGRTEQVYLWERSTRAVLLISRGAAGAAANAPCRNPRISADAGTVVFDSAADNLDGATNGWRHIFVYRRAPQTLQRLSRSVDGSPLDGHALRPAISQAGRYLAFEADATQLVDDDRNAHRDIFVHDLASGRTARLNQSATGSEADQDGFSAALSGNGRYLGFRSRATTLTDSPEAGTMVAFIANRSRPASDPARLRQLAHGIEPATPANGDSWNMALSVDGRFAVFASDATNLVPADLNSVRDVFICDLGEPLNHPPTASDSSVETAPGSAITISLAGTDADADDLLAAILMAPAHGQLGSVDGSRALDHPAPTVVYTPAPGYVGGDQVRFALSDGVATAAAVVNITVKAPDQPPQLTLSQARLVAATDASQCAIPWGLFQIVDPDEPGAPTPPGLALRLLTEPASGRLSDVGGADLHAGALIAPAAFPLAYAPHSPHTLVVETLCFRALADAWESGTVCLEVVVGGIRQDLRLERGWNLISFRMDPLDREPETLFGQGGRPLADPASAWAWDATTRTYQRAGAVVGGRGYWVYRSGASTTLSAVVGRPSATTARLIPGWNLLGPVGAGSAPASLVGGEQGTTALWAWDAIRQRYQGARGLDAGRGYWIHTLSGTELSLGLE